MDVLRLNEATYEPDSLVEGYNSMIWTERFIENGDFEMKTAMVGETMALIPEDSLISLLDSKEVMFVENHSVERDAEGNAELTVTGRTFETFLEDRAFIGAEHNVPWQVLKQYTPAQMSAMILWDKLVNTSGQDPATIDGIHGVEDAVPMLVITDSTTFIGVPQDWFLNQGNAYQQFRDILALGGAGVRTIRPSSQGKVVSFNVPSNQSPVRGNMLTAAFADISELRLDLYNGTNRSRNQTAIEPVIFHYQSGHLDTPKYFFSSKDYNNVAKVVSSIGNVDVGDLTATGLDRRVLFVDAGDIGDLDYDTFAASLTQRGLIELNNHNRAVLFDAAVSLISPYTYGEDYFLGDLISLLAEYGMENTMLVTEYVRTQDSNGDRGYPTLILAT